MQSVGLKEIDQNDEGAPGEADEAEEELTQAIIQVTHIQKLLDDHEATAQPAHLDLIAEKIKEIILTMQALSLRPEAGSAHLEPLAEKLRNKTRVVISNAVRLKQSTASTTNIRSSTRRRTHSISYFSRAHNQYTDKKYNSPAAEVPTTFGDTTDAEEEISPYSTIPSSLSSSDPSTPTKLSFLQLKDLNAKHDKSHSMPALPTSSPTSPTAKSPSRFAIQSEGSISDTFSTPSTHASLSTSFSKIYIPDLSRIAEGRAGILKNSPLSPKSSSLSSPPSPPPSSSPRALTPPPPKAGMVKSSENIYIKREEITLTVDDGNFSHLDISSSVDEIPSNIGISVTFEDTPERFDSESENSAEKDSISDRPTDMRGWMLKSGVSFMSSWKRRYFVQSSNKLNYHIHPDDITPKGYIDLGQSYEIKPTRVGFDIVTTQRIYRLKTDTKDEAEKWIAGLRKWNEWAITVGIKRPPSPGSPSTRQRSASSPVGFGWLTPNKEILSASQPLSVLNSNSVERKESFVSHSEQHTERIKRNEEAIHETQHKAADDAQSSFMQRIEKRLKTELEKVKRESDSYYKKKIRVMKEIVEDKDKLLEQKELELQHLRREVEMLNGKKLESLSLDALEKLEEHFVGVIKVVKERKSKVIREQIEEQKEELWKRNLCKVCNVKPKSVAFVPCGHFEVCQTCADKTTVCHNCKATVKQKIPIHEV